MSRIVIGPKARFSYASVLAPDPRDGKYQVDVLINKQDTETLNAVFAAYSEALASVPNDARFKNVTTQHPSFKQCLKDGDVWKPNDHNYAGHWYFTAKNTQKPEVVGPALEPLVSESQFYSGCYGNVSVEFRTYAPSAQYPSLGYGVNAKLGNIQKVSDGERLSGGAAAIQEFKQTGPPTTAAPIAGYGAQPAPAQQGFPAQAPVQQWGAPVPQPAQQPAPGAFPPAANPFAQPQQTPAPQWGAPAPQQAPTAQPWAPAQQPAPGNPFAPQQQAPQATPAYQAPVNPAAPAPAFPGGAPAPAPQPWEYPR